MPATIKLTETMIRAGSSSQSYARGEEYYHADAIYNTAIQGNLLFGECEGSNAPSYGLEVELDAAGVRSAVCTCPNDWGGYCKHIVALLLTYVRRPEVFSERREITELLADLNREQLAAILDKLLRQQPALRTWLECEVEKPKTKGKTKHKRKTAIETEPYRRQIDAIFRDLESMRPSQAYWAVEGMVEQLREVIDTGYQFLDNGDAEAAMAILLVLAEKIIEHYEIIDDSDGTLGDFAGELNMPMAEAILSAELDESERSKVVSRLKRLAKNYSNYGMDEVLDIAIAAATQGWEEDETKPKAETKLRVCADEDDESLKEQADENELVQIWDEEYRLSFSDSLTEAKLNVLDRQGKVEEFLALSQSSGQYLRYVDKLLDLSRFDDAVTSAMSHLKTANEALSVAHRLRDLGRVDEAFLLGEHGLSLAGRKFDLGQWLGIIHEARGDSQRAVNAYMIAFKERPSLEGYVTLQRLTASKWSELKPKLNKILEKSQDHSVRADVFLHEGEWDAAIQTVEEHGEWSYDLVEKVVEAVMPHRSDWAINACKKQAELLIDRKKSKHYAQAARWLAKAKDAYLRNKRGNEWQAYLSHLRTEYSRRSALIAELRQL